MIKIIFSDLDGVIRHWSSDALNAPEISCVLPPGTVYGICFKKVLLQKAITGVISDEEW